MYRTVVGIAIGFGVIAAALPTQAVPRLRSCPTEIEPLVQAMLRDLPGYANRIAVRSLAQRSSSTARRAPQSRFQPPRSTVILAGRPEFKPLPIRSFSASNSTQPSDPTLQQAFITTLEREVVGNQATNLQQFHWLFLTRTDFGWQLALMFTRTGSDPAIATPPRESSQGTIGQAVTLWLRDCNARSVKTPN